MQPYSSQRQTWELTYAQLISPSDIAIYATLCALASFDRSVIRTEVLDNDTFGVYIEQEPYIRELLESYMGNRFKTVLELLERYSTRHYIDMHLYPHVMNLTNLVRSRALVLYFQPFATIRLERMSVAFGWSVEELEQQVVTLIQAGEIQARVDRENKVCLKRSQPGTVIDVISANIDSQSEGDRSTCSAIR